MSETVQPAGKGQCGLLTLKYLGAGLAAIVSVVSSTMAISLLVSLWANTLASNGILMLLGVNGYVALVTLGVKAVVAGVIAMLLYRKVTKDIAKRPEYVSRRPYIIITNLVFGFFAVMLVGYVVKLVAILISSLVLIGSGADIGAMYLQHFLPYLVSAGLVFVAAFMTYKIVRGKNMSSVMTIALLSAAGAVLLATLITVPIKANSTSTSKEKEYKYEYNLDSFDFSDYLN